VAEGTTVLLTTQYLDEADRLADHISVIDHGRVIAEGSSDELKDQVGGEALEVTLESAGAAEPAIAALAGFCSAPPELDGVVLRVPVLYLQGESDLAVPPAAAEQVRRALPTVRVVRLAGPHGLLQAAPAAAAQAIMSFLTHGC